MESTLSGTLHVKIIGQAKALDYRIEIHYLWIPSPALAIHRIRQRVKMGGHPVPHHDVKRRFTRSLTHFVETYAPLADAWTFRDNSVHAPALLFDSATCTIQQVKQFLFP